MPSSVVPVMSGAGWSIAARPSAAPSPDRPATLTNAQTPIVVRTAIARAMRIGRRGVTCDLRAGRYWAVADPVMFGWIVQTYWYVPAASGGTLTTVSATPVITSLLNASAPVLSLNATSCGIPASWLK